MNDRLVPKRVLNLALMFLATAAVAAVLCALHGLYPDQSLCIAVVVLVYFVLLLFLLEYNRSRRRFSKNRETDYKKIWLGYLSVCLLAVLFSFLPEFVKPVIVFPMIMTAIGSRELALAAGIFWDVILCLVLGFTAQELALYCLMTLFGQILAEAVGEKRAGFWHCTVIFCLSAVLPATFYYLTYQEVKMELFWYGAAEGALMVVFLRLVYTGLVKIRDTEVPEVLADILDDDYPMVRELSGFSKQEYQHARRVSRLAANCAKVVGANEQVCAAAGFYYRIGILDGEPLPESGMRIAQNCCFPESVIRIINEYNGERELPTTIESAIVHMVDGLVKKFEVFDSRTMSSEWNQDMVIYQTLNEFSASGIYDRSGLGMNMFLKIREYLVKEDTLL